MKQLSPVVLAPCPAAIGERASHPVGDDREVLPQGVEPSAVYAVDPDHPLDRIHAWPFITARVPDGFGSSLPAARHGSGSDDADVFVARWYFGMRKGDDLDAAVVRDSCSRWSFEFSSALGGPDPQVCPSALAKPTGGDGERMPKRWHSPGTRRTMSVSAAKPVRLVTGALLNCLACRHGEFTTRTIQLGGGAPSPLGLEWANHSSTCYVCNRCGHVHWFLPPDRKPLEFTVPKPGN